MQGYVSRTTPKTTSQKPESSEGTRANENDAAISSHSPPNLALAVLVLVLVQASLAL